jgi:hypothetical protein
LSAAILNTPPNAIKNTITVTTTFLHISSNPFQ